MCYALYVVLFFMEHSLSCLCLTLPSLLCDEPAPLPLGSDRTNVSASRRGSANSCTDSVLQNKKMFSSKINVVGVGSGVQYLEAWLHDCRRTWG